MSKQRHPFPEKLEKNLLEMSGQQGALRIYNGLLDKTGTIYKRPGLFLNQVIIQPGGIQATYYWPAKKKIIAVAGGKVWSANASAEYLTDVTQVESLLGLGPVKIVDTGHWLYFCSSSGGKMMQWNGTDEATFVTDGIAPVDVSTITYLNQRVIANDRIRNRIWYTRPADLENPAAVLVWEGYLDIGRVGENVIGIEEVGGQLIVFTRDTMQAFYDDGVTPFKPIIGSRQSFGLLSPNALVKFDDTLFFIEPNKTIRVLANRQVSDISTETMGMELDKLRETLSATVYIIDKLVLFNFIEENQTWVYDTRMSTWSQFTTHVSGIEKGFFGFCAFSLPTVLESVAWIMGASDGGLYFWDPTAYTDAGSPIRFSVQTMHHGWGTSYRKQSTRLLVKVSTEAPKVSAIIDINLPDAMRCVVYSKEITLPQGVSVILSGLPAGFAATQVDRVLTVSGITGVFAGTVPVTATIRDSAGAISTKTISFTVNDYDIEVGVLE